MDQEQQSMLLIVHGGNARSLASEAFELALSGDAPGAATERLIRVLEVRTCRV